MFSYYVKIIVLLCCLSIAFGEEKYFEGNACTVTQTGEAGECRGFANCTSAMRLSAEGVFPQVCSCVDETVCCGPTSCPPLKPGIVNIEETGYKAWDYCISLADRVFPCQETENGWTRLDNCPPVPDQNQTDGILVPGDYPHMARLAYGDLSSPAWYCVGSLVSDEWILTSSWCLNLVSKPTFATVGGWGLGSPVLSNTYSVYRTVSHPEYNSSLSYQLPGLVQLTKRVVLSKFVLPACLHTGTSLSDDGLIMTGWNQTDLGGFEKWPLDKVSQEECSEKIPAESWIPDGVRESAHVCTKVRSNGGSCGVISGSVLQQYRSDRVACTYLLSGLYAFASADCQTHVFTRVAPHVPWIESVVWPSVQTEL